MEPFNDDLWDPKTQQKRAPIQASTLSILTTFTLAFRTDPTKTFRSRGRED